MVLKVITILIHLPPLDDRVLILGTLSLYYFIGILTVLFLSVT